MGQQEAKEGADSQAPSLSADAGRVAELHGPQPAVPGGVPGGLLGHGPSSGGAPAGGALGGTGGFSQGTGTGQMLYGLGGLAATKPGSNPLSPLVGQGQGISLGLTPQARPPWTRLFLFHLNPLTSRNRPHSPAQGDLPRPLPTPSAKLEPSAPVFSPAPSFATALNIETLLAAAENRAAAAPEEAVVDKVHFLVNNLSASNLDVKARDVRGRLPEHYWPWFATYLVVKARKACSRPCFSGVVFPGGLCSLALPAPPTLPAAQLQRASIEPNFHALYLGLLENLAEASLTKAVLDCTHLNIKVRQRSLSQLPPNSPAILHTTVQVLLRSDKIKTSSGERSLLKNLGAWLGSLTLARYRPVRQRDLDLKALLLDAFQARSSQSARSIGFITVILFASHLADARLAQQSFSLMLMLRHPRRAA